MKLFPLTAYIVAFNLVRDVTSQNQVITYTSKGNQSLQCTLEDGSVSLQWIDQPSVAIYSYIPSTEAVTDVRTGSKYDNFAYSATQTNFDLIIQNVDKDDGGNYLCTQVPEGTIGYELRVEVVTNVTINHEGTLVVNVSETYMLICEAKGIRTVDTSELVWNTDDSTEKGELTRTTNQDDSTLEDLTSTYVLNPERTDTFVQCYITGYRTEREINAEHISHTIPLTVQYPPVCVLELQQEVKNCTSVTLICNCTAFPEVEDNESYSYYQNGTLIEDAAGSSVKRQVDLDSATEFYCFAANDLGDGPHSDNVIHVCLSTTTPTPVKTDEPPPTKVKGQGLETYAIILIVLACVGAAGGTGFAVYWFGFRTSSRKRSVTGSNNDNTDGNGVNSKLQSEPDQVEYAAVNKPKSDPQPAPRSSKPPGNNTEPEKMELQYADIDHSNRGRSNEIHQPADAPTEYATVQSVIV